MESHAQFPVQLVPDSSAPSGESQTWFLPSNDPAAWLHALCHPTLDQAQIRFFVLASPKDPDTARGIFVRLPAPAPRSSFPAAALPCHAHHNRLFIPEGAALRFPLLPSDLDTLLPGNSFAVSHPSLGWILFDLQDGIGLELLLFPPAVQPSTWDRAIHSQDSSPKLLGVEASLPPEIQKMLQQGNDDIGGTDLDNLQSRPDENPIGNLAQDLSDSFRRKLQEKLQKLGQSNPPGDQNPTSASNADTGTTSTPGWVDSLQKWAESGMEQLSSHQNRQLDRLLDLFEKDPDKALQYAIPLGEHGAKTRGRSNLSGDLLSGRNTNFNLGDVFAGGRLSGGNFFLNDDRYRILQTTYRESANRELQLGRYRRAAYIFAQLLGDYDSAANALKQGKHFAEAAALYEKKLNALSSAAYAYRDAAMFEDAIRLFEKMGDHFELGCLYQDLQRPHEAEAAFESAVQESLQQGSFIEAADLLTTHLHAPDRALQVYRDGWPNSKQALACLKAEFRHYQDNEQHDAALIRLQELTNTTTCPTAADRLWAELATELSHSYPSDVVTKAAADATRTVTSRILHRNDTHLTQKRAVLDNLPKVDSDDRLLLRDARRFALRLPSRVTPPSPGTTPKGSGTIHPLLTFSAKNTISYQHALPWNGGLALIGLDGRTPHFFELPNLDQDSVTSFPLELPPESQAPSIYTENPLQLCYASAPFGLDQPGFIIRSKVPLDTRTHHSRSGQSFSIGNLPGTADAIGLAEDPSDNARYQLTVDPSSHAIILLVWKGNDLLKTHHITTIPEEADFSGPWIPMVAARSQLFFGIGQNLARFTDGKIDWLTLPHPIQNLAATSPHAALRIAVGMTLGAAVVWGDRSWNKSELFADHLTNPLVTLTRSGHAIASDHQNIVTFSTEAQTLSHFATTSPTKSTIPPIALTPGSRVDQFTRILPSQIETYHLT